MITTGQDLCKLLIAGILAVCLATSGCMSRASGRYFGLTEAPRDNVLRYVTGSEPESLDPHISSGQPEARIYMALYEGLVEYHPRSMQPIPAIAKSWDISPDLDVFIFQLRDNAKWSDGTPINAQDFVYSLRRGFDPDTLSRLAGLGYAIKYAEAYNAHKAFVKKDGRFLLETDLDPESRSAAKKPFGPETEHFNFVSAAARLTVDDDEKARNEAADADPKLKELLTGAEIVPVTAEDIGVEAIDDLTLRITLSQSAPYFLGLLPHQFFRLVPRHVVEKHGKNWTRPANIVNNGPFRLVTHRPYDIIEVERNEHYWDAANVHLNGIKFLPVEEKSTTMNLYKANELHAIFNHVVPSPWIDEIKRYEDEYMNLPEAATAYYSFNTTKPPFDNVSVRRAFDAAIDRTALSDMRKVTVPLYGLTPYKIFPEYDAARERVSDEIRRERGVSVEEWANRKDFDPVRARKTLTDAGFPVLGDEGNYSCPSFPIDKVALLFNTNESNRQIAEFVQAQWKRHLGITVPLKNMEFRTFLPIRNALEYDGFAQSLWIGDYMDPFTFLYLYYGKKNDGGSGYYDPKYDKMLDDANRELDPTKRFEMMARAEFYIMDQLPVTPLSTNATNFMKKPFVKGLYPNAGTLHAWKFIYIEQDPAKWDTKVAEILDRPDTQVDAQLDALMATMKARQGSN